MLGQENGHRMILDTNERILLAETEKHRLFRKFGDLEAIPVPVDSIRSAPTRLLPFEDISDSLRSFAAQSAHSDLLAETVVILNKRLLNYTPFVTCARELVENLASVATRSYMMTTYGQESEAKVANWADFKAEVVRIYEDLDILLEQPEGDRRHHTVIKLRALYEEAMSSLPENFRVRYQLAFTDELIGRMNLLMEQCEVYALVEDISR